MNNSLAEVHPELASEWSEKNLTLTPDDITFLIWETVIGERDANFNHVAASGCSNVKDVINAKHPLRNKIFSYYNSMVQSVQNHATIPSFCNKSSGSAKTIELEWKSNFEYYDDQLPILFLLAVCQFLLQGSVRLFLLFLLVLSYSF